MRQKNKEIKETTDKKKPNENALRIEIFEESMQKLELLKVA